MGKRWGGFWRGARRGASASSRATVEPAVVAVFPRLVVAEATGAELQAAPPCGRP